MERDGKLSGDFVLDSSVIVKWFCDEEGTGMSLKFRDGYAKGDVNIACPDLVLYEIANALRFNKKITEDDVKNSVNSIIDIGIDIIVPTKTVLESAISLAFKYDTTLYDAYFIALAKDLSYIFITSDDNFFKKVKGLDFVKLLKDF